MWGVPRSAWLVVALGAAASASCFNPVHSDAVNALGGEVGGVGPGPRHRPGQPCLVCHGGDGPGPEFAIGGTVYATRAGPDALPGVEVVLTDANKATKTVVSNASGNFYISKIEWSPTYPVFVRLDYNRVSKDMVSRIGGRGDCAYCHYGADNEASHMPHVYMSEK